MINIYKAITVMMLFCFLHVPKATSQDILKKTSKELCLCLEEKSKNDTLNLTPKQILDQCMGASMATNRLALAEKYDLGTISGIKALRDELVGELKKNCKEFVLLFPENLSGIER